MSENPFDDKQRIDYSNPFDDPTIAHALQSNTHVADEVGFPTATHRANDIPMNETSFTQYGDHHTFSNSTSPTVGTGAASPAQGATDSAKEEELRRRERELEERERALADRVERLQQGKPKNNFPPCFPIMYLDIQNEIPPESHLVMTWLFREWLATVVCLIWNCVADFFVLVSHPPSITTAPADFGVSLIHCFTITAASFFLWFRPVYNAFMKERSLYYYFFFVFNGCHVAFVAYTAVGIPGSGGAGAIMAISLFSDGYITSGIAVSISAILWIALGVLAVILFQRVHSHYSAAGHTFSEAKRDAYSRMAQSGVVQAAGQSYLQSQAQRFTGRGGNNS
ncbi:uncharacterized protein VTP21DRAFT_9743 [Calcarisporiella thermophila]|uniref:uncharacterized protein n=1 Tax=Calcarisporiella thermophila TaxID=911321 RepID=UPI003743F368